jgi:hypothetical protein
LEIPSNEAPSEGHSLFNVRTLMKVLLMKTFVRIPSFAFLISMIVMIALSSVLYSQSKTINTGNLIRESEVIVHGNVTGRMAEWTPKHDKIQTRVTVAVDQTLKGTVPGSTMTVVVPGGEVDGVGEWYSHIARFDADEEVVLFAKQDRGGIFRIAGGEAGKFTVKKDPTTGSKTISNNGTLEAFTSRIKSTVKQQQANTNKEQ